MMFECVEVRKPCLYEKGKLYDMSRLIFNDYCKPRRTMFELNGAVEYVMPKDKREDWAARFEPVK